MKNVLVTGAAGGLGKAMVQHLSHNGLRVFATDLTALNKNEFSNPSLVYPLQMDVTSEESLTQAYHEISSQCSGLDGLVNNAGVALFGPAAETPIGQMKQLMDVNFLGPQMVTRTFFPLLVKNKGRVLNMSSESIKYLAPFSLYSISKCCLENWHRVLEQELHLLGMKTILIRPGAHETPLVHNYRITKPDQTQFSREIDAFHRQAARGSRKTYPPSDVAKVVFKALTTENPASLYHVNNNPLLTLLRWLPRFAQIRLNLYLLKRTPS